MNNEELLDEVVLLRDEGTVNGPGMVRLERDMLVRELTGSFSLMGDHIRLEDEDAILVYERGAKVKRKRLSDYCTQEIRRRTTYRKYEVLTARSGRGCEVGELDGAPGGRHHLGSVARRVESR